jgi:TetR/AcrR family transcriptional regulator, transcriptional repressor for nem operon
MATTHTAGEAPAPPRTASRILDIAEGLTQTRGYNGFSYADIAAELGITKASLHHHFASKAELGLALIARYADGFAGALRAIDDGGDDALGKLRSYAKLYEAVLRGQRLCLCGMLAAEYATLPQPMQEAIRKFLDLNEAWLARVMEEGRASKLLRADGSPREMARMLLGALEGAMLVAWPYRDTRRFESAARQLLAAVAAPPSVRRSSRPHAPRRPKRA